MSSTQFAKSWRLWADRARQGWSALARSSGGHTVDHALTSYADYKTFSAVAYRSLIGFCSPVLPDGVAAAMDRY